MTIDRDAYEWIDKGNALFDSGRYKKAIRSYEKAFEMDQDDVDAWTWIEIGNRLYELEKYQEATKYYDKAISVDKHAAWAWRNKGLSLSILGKYTEAIKCYDKAIRIDRYFLDAWIDKGSAYCSLGKLKTAMKYFDKAIEIDPDFSDAWARKGNALYDMQKYHEAITCYDTAAKLDRYNIWAWTYKGHALDLLGNHKEAVKQYRKAVRNSDRAISNNPEDLYIQLAKGDSLLAMDQISEAKKCLKKALNLEPTNADILMKLGAVYSDYTFEPKKGIEISQQMLKINPRNEFAKAGMVEDLTAVGRYREARRYASQVMKETQNVVFQSVMRYLVFASYVLEGKIVSSHKAFTEFVNYYRSLGDDFKIEENQWIFRGLIHAIRKSTTKPQTKYLLLSLIDLLKGEIDRRRLSFFHAS